MSDNRPHFFLRSFQTVLREEYQFEHVTSSPYYPQSNGEADEAVGMIKRLLDKEGDPTWCCYLIGKHLYIIDYSPSELHAIIEGIPSIFTQNSVFTRQLSPVDSGSGFVSARNSNHF